MKTALAPDLIVTASPHVRSQDSTPRIMWNVVAALAARCW
jgi:Na+-translocating ferredoxin:NAD+ oxidoreductase RnfD subunit